MEIIELNRVELAFKELEVLRIKSQPKPPLCLTCTIRPRCRLTW